MAASTRQQKVNSFHFVFAWLVQHVVLHEL